MYDRILETENTLKAKKCKYDLIQIYWKTGVCSFETKLNIIYCNLECYCFLDGSGSSGLKRDLFQSWLTLIVEGLSHDWAHCLIAHPSLPVNSVETEKTNIHTSMSENRNQENTCRCYVIVTLNSGRQGAPHRSWSQGWFIAGLKWIWLQPSSEPIRLRDVLLLELTLIKGSDPCEDAPSAGVQKSDSEMLCHQKLLLAFIKRLILRVLFLSHSVPADWFVLAVRESLNRQDFMPDFNTQQTLVVLSLQ